MPDTYLSLLEQRRPDIEKMLAEWITPERFFAMAMQLEKNPALKKCTASSLVECVIMSAQAGLEVGGERGHVYIIPYGDIAQAQIGWRGFAFLKHKTGAIIQLDTDVVFDDDEFKVSRDSHGNSEFHHAPNFKGDRTEKSAYAAYALVKLPSGDAQYEVLGKNRILRHRAHSKQPNGMLWTEFWEEGWRKTPWRVLQKRLPEGVNKDAIDRYNRALDIEVSQFRDDDEFAKPDDMPRATDGTEAPTPRRVKVEVVKDSKQDRIVSAAESDELFDQWISLGGKRSLLEAFLQKNFKVNDLAELKLSQIEATSAAMQQELGA